MKITSREIEKTSEANGGMADISAEVQKAVEESGVKAGVAVLFSVGSTGALSTIEFEPGLQKDFPEVMEKIAPRNAAYAHDQRWHDGNGSSHVKACLVGPSLTVPILKGKLTLGTWQQIVLINFDTRKRTRKAVVQIIGE